MYVPCKTNSLPLFPGAVTEYIEALCSNLINQQTLTPLLRCYGFTFEIWQ